MIITKKILLQLSNKQIRLLKEDHQKIIDFIEQGKSLTVQVVKNLQENFTRIVAADDNWMESLETIQKGGDYCHINLCHSDNTILNLPWGLAVDPHSGHELYRVKQLFLSRTSCEDEKPPFPASHAPLKILVMIAAPIDLPKKYRLNYESEERNILNAFVPLRRLGQVQIDFTENGSLDALRQKIDKNDYHILHFSGHGNYDEKTDIGTLLLENHWSLKMNEATGEEFAEALLKTSHKIPLVVLSSCKTSQGNFAGVTASLLEKGIPAVVSMGMSIADDYATHFAAHFYQRLADQKTVLESFKDAVEYIRAEPFNDDMKKQGKYAPLQWLIPNLYMTQEVSLVDWSVSQPIKSGYAFEKLFFNMALEEAEDEKDLFIGRRQDLANILPPFFSKKPIVLNGQGGIGKTRFARKLVQRLKAYRANVAAFAFHYQGKGKEHFPVTDIETDLKDFCLRHKKGDWVAAVEDHADIYDTLAKRIGFLMDMLADEFEVLILFDNVETFQDLTSQRFSAVHRELLEVLRVMVNNTRIHTIITGRYSVPELGNLVENVDLSDVILNDFWRKLEALGMKGLTESQVTLLYQTLGGNFRALEFFSQVYQQPEDWNDGFRDLNQFKQSIGKATQETIAHTAQDIYFSKLLKLISPPELKLLRWLYYYQLPVQKKALLMQGAREDELEKLAVLKHRTLIQIYMDRETRLSYYYFPPLLKELLRQNKLTVEQPGSFFQKAGNYHLYMVTAVKKGDLGEQAQAFWHYVKAGDRSHTAQLGQELAGFYFGRSLYLESRQVGDAAYQLLGEKSPCNLLNWLGMVYHHFGELNSALIFYQQGLKKLNPENPDDLEDIGMTLNNISQIYDAKGDYDTALSYLEQSLAISRKIGDLAGQIPTLHNMALIYLENKDFQRALDNETEAYQIALKTKDAMGIFQVGKTLGQWLVQIGQKKEGIAMLQQAYQIGSAAGLPGSEEIKKFLDQL